MKKTIAVLVTIVFGSTSVIAQNPWSEIEKLAATAKVWGFLKYYHPEVADGKFNWDQQLFSTLPKVKTATNKEQLSQVYLNWIESLGEVKPCKKCSPKKDVQYFDKNFDLSWISDDQLFTPELSEKLKYIEDNRHQGKKYYVGHHSSSLKIVDFTNEIDHIDFGWQDENLRLLTLFRYWNMVEYFFPYKYQTDMKWDDVLMDMIPKFLSPKSETEFHLAMVELANKIDDGHVRLNTQKTYLHFGHYYLPVQFRVIDNKAVVTGFYNDSLAKLDDLRVGDIITRANGKTIEALFQEEEKYIMGSNDTRKHLNASFYLLNGPSDSLKIETLRGNKTTTKTVKRYLYKDFNYKAKKEPEKYKILEGNIGYIDVGQIGDIKKVTETMKAMQNTKAIIFDTRKSTGPTPDYFANHITPQEGDFYKAIFQDLDYPGRFIWTKTYQMGDGKLKYPGKVIVLVDENCQSQREFTAMCLQTGDHVTTIGNQTAGADGNVVVFNMVGGYKTQFSGVGIFYPDGTETQRKGVKIDIEVKPTLKGVVEGKDEILERAMEFANE